MHFKTLKVKRRLKTELHCLFVNKTCVQLLITYGLFRCNFQSNVGFYVGKLYMNTVNQFILFVNLGGGVKEWKSLNYLLAKIRALFTQQRPISFVFCLLLELLH